MRPNQHIKTVFALTFTLGASLVPAASAHSAVNWAVHPNPDEQTLQLTQVAAAAQPQPSLVARANPDEQGANVARLLSTSGTALIARPNPDQQASPTASPTIVRVTSPKHGFNWRDAGMGMAVGIAISILILGSTLVATRHRRRRPRPSALIAS